MRIWKNEAEFDGRAAVAVLGTFDGVHIGHQVLIRRAIAMAQEENAACVVCTFDRHPLSLLRPERAPKPLMRLEEKLEKLEKMGVDGVLLHTFTAEFASIEPAEYLKSLKQHLNLRGIVAGFNYSFGAHGRGNADLIRSQAKPLDYRAEILPPVQDGGEIVSSTLIRSLLEKGENARAQQLLSLQED